MSFNKTFEKLRRERGETMRDVAVAVGVGVGTVQAWTKESRPHPEAAARLARHYGVSVTELLDGSALSGFEEERAEYKSVKLNPKHALMPREPTEQELIDSFLRTVAAARRVPGGLYQLDRAIKRFQKDHIDPLD